MQLVIAEKPSVGRDLARVLGAKPRGRSQFEGAGYVITWCVGHLVELDEPKAYDARWQAWRFDTLPMLPETFRLRGNKHGADQLRVVQALLGDRRFSAVINACDAGREGELIFRYVYQFASCRLPIKRLWISSLTDEAIRRGFAELRPGEHYEALCDAARSRSEADWLVGLNATRAVTLRARQQGDDKLLSIGRVQTPTLAMLVARDRAIAAFVPRDYWEVGGRFATHDGQAFAARWLHGRVHQLATAALADELATRCATHGASTDPRGPRVARVDGKTQREPPPQLFDLTSLQRTANRRFGLSAQRTLDVAQALYERHKVLSYPRTDSRHLSTDVAKELPTLFGALARLPEYAPFVAPLLANPPRPGKRVVDDGKVQDHHAIIPTANLGAAASLDGDERRLFDLVARRFLGVFHPDAEFAITTALVVVGAQGQAPAPTELGEAPRSGAAASDETTDRSTDDAPKLWSQPTLPPPPDWFVARGRVRLKAGWQTVAGMAEGAGERRDKRASRDDKDAEADASSEPLESLPILVAGQALDGEFTPERKQTLPPRPYTEASLLSAMESAGKALSDDELRAAMKDTGLGTPATRAAIIETLLKREYARRDRKQITATAAGRALIDAVPVPSLASAELTGEWEARLARIARREDSRSAFMADIARYVTEVVQAIRGRGAAAAGAPPRAPSAARPPPSLPLATTNGSQSRPSPPLATPAAIRALLCPRCRVGHLLAGKRGWGCDQWRSGCRFVVWFETAGRQLTEEELRDLVVHGETRPAAFAPSGHPLEGRLRLDVDLEGGARFEPSETSPTKPKKAPGKRRPKKPRS